MTTPSASPQPNRPAERPRGSEVAKTNGARAALAGGVLAVVGILLMVVGSANLAGIGVIIAVIAILPTVYGAYLFFVGADRGRAT